MAPIARSPPGCRHRLAQAWGGGLVASVDGMRFVVPVPSIYARPNPKYFGRRAGATWLNLLRLIASAMDSGEGLKYRRRFSGFLCRDYMTAPLGVRDTRFVGFFAITTGTRTSLHRLDAQVRTPAPTPHRTVRSWCRSFMHRPCTDREHPGEVDVAGAAVETGL